MKKTFFGIVAIVIVIVGLFAAMAVRAPKAPPPSTHDIWAKEGIPVETGAATRGDMEQTVEVTGDINALSKVTLSAKIAGRIAQVYVREGDRVSQGMTVAVLDQADALSNLKQAQAGLDSAKTRLSQAVTNAKVTRIQMAAAIEQAKSALNSAIAKLAVVKKPARSQDELAAQASVASAKATLDNAEANYKREQQLLNEGAVSQSSLDTMRTLYLQAKALYSTAQEQLSLIKEGGRKEDITAAQAQVDTAREGVRTARANAAQNLLRAEDIKQAASAIKQSEAAVAMAREQLSYTIIKSPISGEVASRVADPGQVVAPGQAIADVVNLASVYFKGDVSEKQLEAVRKGELVNVKLDALPDRLFRGTVEEIYPSGSTVSRNFPVRIRIDKTGSVIRPGMFARGDIVTGIDRNVLLVPKDAVEERKGTKLVFTLGPNHKVKRHDVDAVRENRDHVEVATPAGFDAGDPLVTAGHQNLQDGSVISVKNGE